MRTRTPRTRTWRTRLGLLVAASLTAAVSASGGAVDAAAAPAGGHPRCAGHDHHTCVPRTVVLDGHRLAETRRALHEGSDPARTAALTALLAQADAELTTGPWTVTGKQQLPPSGDRHDYLSLAPYYWPTEPQTPDNPWGCPYENRDGRRNPIVDTIPDHAGRLDAFTAIYQLSLAWYYTGDRRYADRAELDLRTWFTDPATRMNPNMNYAQGIPCQVDGRGIGIIEFSYLLTQVVDATAILDAGAPGWTDGDRQGVLGWDGAFLDWLRTSKNGREETAASNNHGSFDDLMTAALALYTGRTDTARRIVREAAGKRLDVQIDADGSQPQERTRTRTWHYFNFNLVALTRLAQLGRHLGIDLWDHRTPAGSDLADAVDFLITTATGTPADWPYPETDLRRYAALDVLHAAADAGDDAARRALPDVPPPPGGDLYPVRPAAEQLDDISKA
ncbi:alginate lyase family protein [Kitasatospora sp. NPDC096077]|uniref:alginate lyase family protein n=1 Tax=Kitasatospora sp. NPDC096077 TaxID=3155544 RepID=UPI00332FFAB9